MKIRIDTAAVITGALTLSLSGAQAAGKPVLDGKQTKSLQITAQGGFQDNDKETVTSLIKTPDRLACTAPRCTKLTFTYLPAPGVKGDLMFTATWANPASDIDLYVGAVGKDGSATDIGHCGGTGTTT